MANIKSFLTLQDNMSSTLSKVQKNALKNITTFNKMSKEVDDLKQSLDEAAKINPDIVNTKMMDDAVAGYDALRTKLYDVAQGNDKFEESNDRVNASMTEVNQTLEVAQKAWNMLSRAVQEASKWMEISNNQFNSEYTSAVKMHGVLGASEAEISSMYDYASALQKVGVVGDEATLTGMSTLTMYADNIDQVRKLTPAILDLAVAENGLDTSQANVESTAQRVGYALNGNATMLKRMIGATDAEIKTLNNMNDKTKKAEYLFKLLESRVGGANETLAKTAQGGMMQANNALGDLQERLGTQVVPYFAAFKQILVDILTPIVNFVEANSDWLIPTLIAAGAGLAVLIGALTIYKIAAFLAAGANVAFMLPLLPIILLIAGFVLAINLAAQALSDWTGTSVSAIGLVTSMIAVAFTFMQNIGIDLYNILMGITNGIALLFIGMAQIIIGQINTIAQAIDAVFGSNLSSATQGLMNKLDAAGQSILEDGGYMERKSYQDAANEGYLKGANFSDKINTKIKTAGASTGNLNDWISNMDGINKNLDGLIGTDGAGGKALKTTSNDNLLSDEDIQMLLDIATRDYQLNYQQMTPNISVNFGDVRETADVNQVLDAVGTKIEELIYGDAEVVY